MHHYDLGQHEIARARAVAEANHIAYSAAEGQRCFADARNLQSRHGSLGQAGMQELVIAAGQAGAGGIERLGQCFSADVHHTFRHLVEIVQGILGRAWPSSNGEKASTGGSTLATLKNEKGARLALPAESRVETQAMGRGAMAPENNR